MHRPNRHPPSKPENLSTLSPSASFQRINAASKQTTKRILKSTFGQLGNPLTPGFYNFAFSRLPPPPPPFHPLPHPTWNTRTFLDDAIRNKLPVRKSRARKDECYKLPWEETGATGCPGGVGTPQAARGRRADATGYPEKRRTPQAILVPRRRVGGARPAVLPQGLST